MIDLEKARLAFEEYLEQFCREDEKIKLKIVHTKGVVRCAAKICDGMGLSREDCDLAQLIALLHDIGRFEQLRQFDSFWPETMDHASYGVELLFGTSRMIRKFVPEDKWDEVIRVAIAKHSDFALEGISDERKLMHARIIRDADKLDNCRVKLEDDFEAFLGVPAEKVSSSVITRKVREDALAGRSILSSDRVTPMDYWVSYLVYFYDLNYRASLDIVEENDYVRRLIRRIPYLDPDTGRVMEELENRLIKYVSEAKKDCGRRG